MAPILATNRPPAESASMTKSATILLVDTVRPPHGDLVALLSRSPYGVMEVDSIDDAEIACASKGPKLAVLRAAEPGIVPICARLKAANPNLFVLAITPATGPASDGEVDPCVDAVLIEPIDPRELLTLVRSLLRLRQVESELRESEERLELAQESAELAILDWRITTNTFVYSPVFAALFDLPERAADEPFSSATLIERIHPEDLGPMLTEFAAESQSARRFDKEFRISLRDGRIRWISARGRFFVSASGSPERMLSLCFDNTERKEAERANAQLASIVTSSIDAIVSVGLDQAITTWNDGAERLFGYTRDEMIGQPLDRVVADDGETSGVEHRRRRLVDEPAVYETTQATKNGDRIDISVNSAPMRGPNGSVIGASLIMRDIAPQKRREDHVRFLMRELTHRSKNLLAVIQAMARQSLSKEITPEEFVKRFSDRLSGLAGSHDLLSAVDWKGASLVDLIRSQLQHYEDLFDARIILEGVDIIVRPEAAQNIGIALHELSTNAAKYGALSTPEGRVTIAWSIQEDASARRRMTMTWREENGPVVVAPTRRGFGRIVMDRIAGQALSGTSGTRFLDGGVVWTLDVPAASVVYE